MKRLDVVDTVIFLLIVAALLWIVFFAVSTSVMRRVKTPESAWRTYRGAGWWLDGTPTVFASHAPLKKGRLIVEFRIVEDARG